MSQRHQRAHLAAGHYKAPSPATKTREIKPKPVSNGAQGPATPAPAVGTPRRRGRPSNAEIALRAKEAAERGEDYPVTSASKKRKSIADLPGAGSPTPGSEPPVKRGRGRPPKNKPSVPNVSILFFAFFLLMLVLLTLLISLKAEMPSCLLKRDLLELE